MTDPITPLSDSDEQAIRERESKASPGPWQQTHDVKRGVKIWPREGMALFIVAGGVTYSRVTPDDPVPQWQKDADFVRHAREDIPSLLSELTRLRDECDRLSALLNTPELHDFATAVVLEAAHQRERWGIEHDAGKEPQDWFWVVGYLAGKALRSHIEGNQEKALHHTISTAAALANWHAHVLTGSSTMRPGMSPEKQADADEMAGEAVHAT